MHTTHIRASALAAVVLSALVGAQTVPADIYRWDNGELIPGTEGIEPGPGVQLDHRQLQYAKLGGWFPHDGFDVSGVDFEASNLTYAELSNSTFTSQN